MQDRQDKKVHQPQQHIELVIVQILEGGDHKRKKRK